MEMTGMKDNLHSTLIVIPCSARKTDNRGNGSGGSSILDSLTPATAKLLRQARKDNAPRAKLDERSLVPAWKRYQGSFYTTAGQALARAVAAGLHVLIVSGGYGVVTATEPIGLYQARLNLSDWPSGLLGRCLWEYAHWHSLTNVVAFMPSTTDYPKVIRRAGWSESGAQEVRLVTVDLLSAGGAMSRVPKALGEAFALFVGGRPIRAGQNLDGAQVLVHRLV